MNLNLAQSLSTSRLTVDNPYGALARLTIRGILKGDIGTRRMTLRIKGTTMEVARQLTPALARATSAVSNKEQPS